MTVTPLATWRLENAEWLRLRLCGLRAQLHRRALWLHGGGTETRAVDWLIAPDDAMLERRFFAEDSRVKTLDARIRVLDAKRAERERRMDEAGRSPALLELARLTGLGAFGTDLLVLAAAPALDGAFGRAYAELHDDPRRDAATLYLALVLFVNDPAERLVAADALAPSRPLASLRLVDIRDEPGEPMLTRALSVDGRMSDFVRGVNRTDARLVPLLEAAPRALDGAMARGGEAIAAILSAEPERWLTLCLLGTVEGGARDAAQAACEAVGLRLHTLDAARLAAHSPAEREALIALIGREALLAGTAVLVDAQAVERGSGASGVFDDLIARLGATLFVVGPERWHGAPTSHVVSLPRPTRAEQNALWRTALGGYRNSVNGEVDAIVQQFDFGPGTIADVVARAACGPGGVITGAGLWRSCREQTGPALNDLAKRITPAYGWEDIVVSDGVRAQLRELAGQVEQRGRVYEAWGFGAQLTRGRGITALFAGLSGTGKTMAAEILAAHLELDLYRIDLAGVVSKYIGETEKNLRKVFDAAQRSGAILLFDEADALFGTRTEVRDSHDRYANVEINYLLQQMEDYTGLAILATNRRGSLDPAFLRRLRFVIEFPFPSVDDRRRIWERVFPAQAERGALEYEFLSRLELPGGNIRSIAINAAFLAAADHAPIAMPHLVRAAAREYTKLSRPISAAEFGPYFAVARQ
jgi:hypothetical protein